MATKRSMWILFGILVILAWVLGSAIQVGAETLNYKAYNYMIKSERALVGDVEGHTLSLGIRRSILVFENGETGTAYSISTTDHIKGSGPFLQYTTITFADGSTMLIKQQGTTGGGTAVGAYTSPEYTGEIIKGTGRFDGVKGIQRSRGKFFPLEKGEDGPKGIIECTLTYTLPSK